MSDAKEKLKALQLTIDKLKKTYGKGTVQRNIGLDPDNGFSMSNSDLGTIKLTLQKFYRINGGSTQLKGVTPVIVLPDNEIW